MYRRFPVLLIPVALAAGACRFASAAAATDDATHWIRVEATHAQLRQVVGADADSVDYGRFQWLGVDAVELSRLQAAGFAVSEVEAPFVLDLGGERFDPAHSPPTPSREWDRSGVPANGNDLRLVQFAGPVRQSALDQLRAGGLEPVQYIHPFTYVVWGSRAALRDAAPRIGARWSGDFLPAYRVLPRWRTLDARAIEAQVSVYRGAANVEAALRAAGATVTGARAIDRHFRSIGVHVAGTGFARLAAIPGVYSVQPVPTDGGLRAEMSDQVNAGNVDEDNFAFPGYLAYLDHVGVDGAGVIVADVDGGIYDNHPDLVNRMLPCIGDSCGGAATDSHGTHTAGIMAADGSSGVMTSNGFLRGLGMAPGANLVEQLYSPFFTQPGGMLFLMTDSVRNDAVMSGNSWGPSGTPRGYDDDTRQVDVGVRDADPDAAGDQPLHFVLSFMNGGGGVSTQGTPDEGKNLFTIGSTWMQDSPTAQNPAIDDLSSNTAHGPALDGRSIPALVAPGCDVDSTISATGYGLLCGTSMASPHVTGASALFVEYYRNLVGGNPSPALIKAAFTAVAKNLTGHLDADGHVMTHLFDSKQGWGRMLVDPVLAPQQAVQYIDQDVLFDNTGESWTRTFSADDPAQPIRIMLAWTDAPGHGLGGSTPAWNNDLDLRVAANGETFRGNVLDAGGWSTGGGSSDAMNNTEAVFLQPAQHAGEITIEVVASDINSDALPNSGDDTEQDFALVCYNCSDAATAVANLAITASSVSAYAEPGEAIQYSVDVTNSGPAAATGIAVAVVSPDLQSVSAPGMPEWTCVPSSETDTFCTYAGELAAGASIALALDALVAAVAADPLVAAFSVTATEDDSDGTNNAVVVETPLLDRIFADDFELPQSP